MKKAGILSVLMTFGMMSNASAFIDPVSSTVLGYTAGVATVALAEEFFGRGTMATLKAGGCGVTGANEYYSIGNGQCVECDSGQGNAPNGTVAYHYNGKFPVQSRACHRSNGDWWGSRGDVRYCPNHSCKQDGGAGLVALPGTTKYFLCIRKGQSYQTLGDSVFVSGGGNCIVDKAKIPPAGNPKCPVAKGYLKTGDRVGASCSDHTDKTVVSKLTSIEHVKTGALCDYLCGTNGWVVTLRADSCDENYQPSDDKRVCVAKPGADQGNNGGGGNGGGNGGGGTTVVVIDGGGNGGGGSSAKRTACVNSGGTFANNNCSCDANKNMEVSNGTCICKAGYEWVAAGAPSQGCKITNTETLKRACDAATNADWNATTQKCVCKDADYELDVNAQTCKPIAALAECQPLMSKNKARWDTASKTCSCIQAGHVISNGDCVETAEAATARKDKEMKSAKNKIEDVHSKLKRVQDGFKVSAWKNEEGKFNTARLASDSIAGVVLGTAGGLVTSKVVKKNQVENGFEDIQCTIGGQAVAQWGDDFSVGTQF